MNNEDKELTNLSIEQINELFGDIINIPEDADLISVTCWSTCSMDRATYSK